MADLKSFFERQRACDGISSCLALEEPLPFPIQIDYPKLAESISRRTAESQRKVVLGQRRDLFDQNYNVRMDGFEETSPLTSHVVRNMLNAKVDLDACHFKIEMATWWVVPVPIEDVHIDAFIEPVNFDERIRGAAQTTRSVLSNICSTQVLPNAALRNLRPGDVSEDLFLRHILCRIKTGDRYRTRLAELTTAKPSPELVDAVEACAKNITSSAALYRKASPSNAVIFTDKTVHAFTCRQVPQTHPGAQQRHRIAFASHPL